MTDPIAALLRNRVRLLDALAGASFSLQRTVDSRGASLILRAPDSETLARVQKAFAKAIPKTVRTGLGVEFPFADLRGRRADEYLQRIRETFPRLGRKNDRVADVLVFRVIDAFFRKGKDADVEKLIGILGGEPAVVTRASPNSLEVEVSKLVKKRTLLRFERGTVSVTSSHLRGPGYFEEGETWPLDDGKPMELVLQLAKGGPVALPRGVALLQIFFGPSLEPLVKTYARLSPKRQVRPPHVAKKPFAIRGAEDGSVPDFDELPKKIQKLCAAVNPLVPEDAYAAAAKRHVREPAAWSFSGGWPRWLEEPRRPRKASEFLFQVGSQRNVALNWADSGVIHVFGGSGGIDCRLTAG